MDSGQAEASGGHSGESRPVAALPRPRRPRSELREMLISAGRTVLLEEGLTLGVERVTFKRVFDEVERTTGARVTNAAVIDRIWRNQEEFQVDVLLAVLAEEGTEEFEITEEAFNAALALADFSTPISRRASLAELIRVATAAFVEAAQRSAVSIQFALGTYLAAGRAAVPDERLIDAFRRTNEELTERYAEIYQAGLDLVGWRVKPGLAMHDAAVAFSAYAEGIVMRLLVDQDAFAPIKLIRPADGASVDWTLLGIGINSMVEFFAEPDPAWTPPQG